MKKIKNLFTLLFSAFGLLFTTINLNHVNSVKGYEQDIIQFGDKALLSTFSSSDGFLNNYIYSNILVYNDDYFNGTDYVDYIALDLELTFESIGYSSFGDLISDNYDIWEMHFRAPGTIVLDDFYLYSIELDYSTMFYFETDGETYFEIYLDFSELVLNVFRNDYVQSIYFDLYDDYSSYNYMDDTYSFNYLSDYMSNAFVITYYYAFGGYATFFDNVDIVGIDRTNFVYDENLISPFNVFTYGNESMFYDLYQIIDELWYENDSLTNQVESLGAFEGVFGLIKDSIGSTATLLDFELAPNFTLGTLIVIPLAISVILFVFKMLG